MSAPAFTPAPWHVVARTSANPNIVYVWAGTNYLDRELLLFTSATCEESLANARLIAAAPDGYAAAEFSAEIIRMLVAQLATFGVEPACNAQGAIERLEAFTAKARGEQ